jgi:hypothetical protein
MFRLALASMAMMTTAASAQTALPTVLPPVEFDRPFEGVLMMQRLEDEATVRRVCPSSNLGVALGCAYRHREGCLIIMVPDEVIRSYKLSPETVLRHEIGHCHGWPADHKGARVTWPEVETTGRR